MLNLTEEDLEAIERVLVLLQERQALQEKHFKQIADGTFKAEGEKHAPTSSFIDHS